MALIVLDASVVIALLDPADALHAAAKREFDRVAGDDLALPASALAETLVAPARVGRVAAVRGQLNALEIRIVEGGEEVAVVAAEMRARHKGLRLPDALVLATAELLEAELLLTGDASWKGLSGKVRIVT